MFTAGSVLCSLAHSIGQLVAFRAVQGLGASMLNPVALSIIAHVFPQPRDRGAGGGDLGCGGRRLAGAGAVAGRRVDAETVGWRAIFWINLPIGLVAVGAGGAVCAGVEGGARRGPFDPVGQALVFAFLVAVTYAVIDGPHARVGVRRRSVGLFGLARGEPGGLSVL